LKGQFYTSNKALQPWGMAQGCAPIAEQGAEGSWNPRATACWSVSGALDLPGDQLEGAWKLHK